MALNLQLLSQPQFPFSPLGLLHLRSVLTQFKHIAIDQPVNLQLTVDNVKDAPKGIEMDFVVSVTDRKSGEELMKCAQTFLSLNARKAAQSKRNVSY